jgi:phosphoesterase RecJ-like protein
MAVTEQTNVTLQGIAAAFAAGDDFCVCGHVKPDGDSIGSVLGVCAILRALGKRVLALVPDGDPIDEKYDYLPGYDGFVEAAAYSGPCGVFVSVDVPTEERLGAAACEVKHRAGQTITIDHHANDVAVSDLNFVDPDAPSTTTLIWELAGAAGVQNFDIATCTYLGLMTDTGGFRYQNTTSQAFLDAAQMSDFGVDVAQAASRVFQSRSLGAIKLESEMVSRMEMFAEGRAAISWIIEDEIAGFGATKDETSAYVSVLRSIKGVDVACMLRDTGTGVVRASLRAKDSTDVSVIARRFGGGGHKAAAGCNVEGSLKDALPVVKAAICEALACYASAECAPAAVIDAGGVA